MLLVFCECLKTQKVALRYRGEYKRNRKKEEGHSMHIDWAWGLYISKTLECLWWWWASLWGPTDSLTSLELRLGFRGGADRHTHTISIQNLSDSSWRMWIHTEAEVWAHLLCLTGIKKRVRMKPLSFRLSFHNELEFYFSYYCNVLISMLRFCVIVRAATTNR